MLIKGQVLNNRAVEHAAAGTFGRVSASRALRCSSHDSRRPIRTL